MTTAEVLADMRRAARARAVADLRGCALSPADQQRWVEAAVARVTQAHLEAACAWAARFVFEYADIIAETEDGRVAVLAGARLEWWKAVQALGRSQSGWYDSVGTRDRLRGLMRGDFDDEIDACLIVYAGQPHTVAVLEALEQLTKVRAA